MENTDLILYSGDGFLVQKVVSSSTIKRLIDWKSLNITSEYIKEQCNLKYGPLDKKLNFTDKRKIPDTEEEKDRFYITEMCMPYNPPPDERDVFVWYDDIKFLSGSGGYLRIRDGYVINQKIVIRS